jgi:GDP-mannose 6-dehydrogenase
MWTGQRRWMLKTQGNNNLGTLGYSFICDTADLRENPIADVIEAPIGGSCLALYDTKMYVAALVGANNDSKLTHIPHISRVPVDSMNTALEHAETVVFGNKSDKLASAVSKLKESQKPLILCISLT